MILRKIFYEDQDGYEGDGNSYVCIDGKVHIGDYVHPTCECCGLWDRDVEAFLCDGKCLNWPIMADDTQIAEIHKEYDIGGVLYAVLQKKQEINLIHCQKTINGRFWDGFTPDNVCRCENGHYFDFIWEVAISCCPVCGAERED